LKGVVFMLTHPYKRSKGEARLSSEGYEIMARVLGLGAAAMDHVIRCEDLPREDGFAFVHDERLLPGGSCANVLVAAVNLGTPAAIVAKMGDDHYGRAFRTDLEASGVSTHYLVLEKGGTSLHTFVTVARNGVKAIFVHMGNSLSLSASDVHEGMLDDAQVFFTDMIPAQPAIKLARLSVQRSIKVVFHAQVSPGFLDLCGISRRETEAMLASCNLVFGAGHILSELGDRRDPEEAASVLCERYQPDLGVIATLGDRGAVWVNGTRSIFTPALRVNVVDTTGAGDAFAAGLLHAFFTKGLDRKSSMEFATACAAMKCTQTGPRLKARESDILFFLSEG
ncbi:MAG: carbohydrate kinase family protein, partial [Thermodesulfobacteriota bacterium]